MRMWMINPKFLCKNHLLGQHAELHMLAGCMFRGKSIKGFLDKGLLEPQNIYNVHEKVVDEMSIRGYNHKSPLPLGLHVFFDNLIGTVNQFKAMADLMKRCNKCRENILSELTKVKLIDSVG